MQPDTGDMFFDNVLGADNVCAVVGPVENSRHGERGMRPY